MKLGVLFSGGKDSTYAAFLARNLGYEISCLISVISENPESFMFHTPSINQVKKQAEIMELPLVSVSSLGEKEKEIFDLENAICLAIDKYKIEGVVTGAVESVYQASRVERICSKLGIECFNPLWQKDQIELLKELIENKFEVIITGVFAYSLDEKWLGRTIDKKFIEDIKRLRDKYRISPSGEGGEFESFVLNCPLFKRRLEVVNFDISGKGNSFRMEVYVK